MIHFKDTKSLYINYEDIDKIEYSNNSVNFLNSVILKNGQIIKLNDKITFEIEDVISHDYKVNYIRKDKKEKKINLIQFKHNKTTEYILPLLGYTKRELLYDTHLLNAYIYTNLDNIDTNNELILLYRYSDSEEFNRLEKLMSSNKRIDNVFGKKNYVGYLINFDRIRPEVNLIFKGMYTGLSYLHKGRIKAFHLCKPDDPMTRALFNIPEYRLHMERFFQTSIPKDMPLIQIPLMVEETLTANLIL